MELRGTEAYGKLGEQLSTLFSLSTGLIEQTSSLSTALKDTHVRGNWGQIQLKRVVELAGMTEYCDYTPQASFPGDGGEGRKQPDMVVRLPAGKRLAIDSKAPGKAFFEAYEEKDEKVRDVLLTKFSGDVWSHVKDLRSKAYWNSINPSPEFVIMFLPGEFMLEAALSKRPNLLQDAAKNKIILATPATLIAVLMAVFYGWQQQEMATNQVKIGEAGKKLMKRLIVLLGHLTKMGSNLDKTIGTYNEVVGSYNGMVYPQARELKRLMKESESKIPEMVMIDKPRRNFKVDEEEE